MISGTREPRFCGKIQFSFLYFCMSLSGQLPSDICTWSGGGWSNFQNHVSGLCTAISFSLTVPLSLVATELLRGSCKLKHT